MGRKGAFRPGHGRSRLFGRAWAENALSAGARPKIVASAAERPNWAVFGPPVTEVELFGQAAAEKVQISTGRRRERSVLLRFPFSLSVLLYLAPPRRSPPFATHLQIQPTESVDHRNLHRPMVLFFAMG